MTTLKKNGVYLINTKADKYHTTINSTLKKIQKTAPGKGVYISLNRTNTEMNDYFKKNKINTNNLIFIDCTSSTTNNNNPKEQSYHIKGQESLTELSLMINDLINTTNFKYLIFDSLSTLLIYNKPETVERFLQYVINRLHNDKITAIIISLDDEKSKNVVPLIVPMCEGIIK